MARFYYEPAVTLAQDGVGVLKKVVRGMIYSNINNNQPVPPSWGLVSLFSLGSITIFLQIRRPALKWVLLAALFSTGALMSYSLDIRYSIGTCVFLVIIPLGFLLGKFSQVYCHRKTILAITSVLVVIYFGLMSSLVGTFTRIKTSMLVLLSGYSHRNFKSASRNQYHNDIRFVLHLIQARDDSNTPIGSLGIFYGVSPNRTLRYSFANDKQMIIEAAESSANSQDLMQNLKDQSISQIIVNSAWEELFSNRNSAIPFAHLDDMKKIKDLFSNHAVLRYITSDQKILWYDISGRKNLPKIILNEADATQFPITFIKQLMLDYKNNNREEAIQLSQVAINSHILDDLKYQAYMILTQYHNSNKKKMIDILEAGVKDMPRHSDIHLMLGYLYEKSNEMAKAKIFYEKSYELDPKKNKVVIK